MNVSRQCVSFLQDNNNNNNNNNLQLGYHPLAVVSYIYTNMKRTVPCAFIKSGTVYAC